MGKELDSTVRSNDNVNATPRMTNICYIKLLTLFVLMAILSTSCNRKTAEERRQLEALQSSRSTLLNDIVASDAADGKADLLALKYDLPLTNVLHILNRIRPQEKSSALFEVLKLNSLEKIEQYKAGTTKTNLTDAVIEYSKQTGISSQKIAAIIIDYEIWTEAEERVH